jgi:hypothetical protein
VRTREIDRQEPTQAKRTVLEAKLAVDERIAFEGKLERYVVFSGKSTHYGLLGIAGDCDKAGIKQSFYALARKFHPDRHRHHYLVRSAKRSCRCGIVSF